MSATKLMLTLLATLMIAGCQSLPTQEICQATPPTWTLGATNIDGIVQIPEEDFGELIRYVIELESCNGQ